MKRNYTINIPAGFFWKRIVPGLLVFGVFGVIAGVFVVDRLVMPNIVGVNRDVVTVPGVTRLPLDEGREALYKAGLLSEVCGREYDDTIPVNAIVNQSPESGSRVKKGRKITVVVSKGKEIGIIPDVRNVSERQAYIIMKKSGFAIGKVKKIYHEEKPAETVIDAFPASGTTTSREIEVDLFISKGPKPTHAEVPNLVGESLKTAKTQIVESGLSVGEVTYQNNPSLLPGTIISQSEAPGSRVPLESKLQLVVSVIR